jgi:hypothetical protein
MEDVIEFKLTDDQAMTLIKQLLSIGFEPVTDNLIRNADSDEDTKAGD